MATMAQDRLGGWQQAVQLYATLAGGPPPPRVVAPDLPAGGVYMDVPFRFARYFGTNAAYAPAGMFAVGSPGFVAGAVVGNAIGNTIGYARAAAARRPQWRGHNLARVLVTDSATWCGLQGRWLRYYHDGVVSYQLTDQPASIHGFTEIDPLRLFGPSAWCHAVLFAYLRDGASCWQNAPFLQPIRAAALQLVTAR